jgi:hypothetical protein
MNGKVPPMALTDIICKNAKYLTQDDRAKAIEHNSTSKKKVQQSNKLSDVADCTY